VLMLLHTLARDVPAHPPLPPKQAMEYERLGPERPRYSDVARRRIAGMEAATALTCTLLPAIEPVLTVSRAQQGACFQPRWPASGSLQSSTLAVSANHSVHASASRTVDSWSV
jgi:hypothetical protein